MYESLYLINKKNGGKLYLPSIQTAHIIFYKLFISIFYLV